MFKFRPVVRMWIFVCPRLTSEAVTEYDVNYSHPCLWICPQKLWGRHIHQVDWGSLKSKLGKEGARTRRVTNNGKLMGSMDWRICRGWRIIQVRLLKALSRRCDQSMPGDSGDYAQLLVVARLSEMLSVLQSQLGRNCKYRCSFFTFR